MDEIQAKVLYVQPELDFKKEDHPVKMNNAIAASCGVSKAETIVSVVL